MTAPVHQRWSEAEVLALPVVFDLMTAADVLAIGRTRAYEMARTGELPTLRLGNRYRVTRRALLELLDIAPPNSSAGPPTGPAAATSKAITSTH